MTGSPRFWNWIAKWYAKNPVPDEEAYARKLEGAAARLTPSSRVLEFGCGTGTTAVHLAPKAGSITAVDFSAGMLEIAQQRAADADVSNITFTANTIENFAGDPGAYDIVMMHSLLHLLPNPGAAIVKAHRLLTPGGWFLSSTTALGDDGLARVALLMRPAAALGVLPRLTVFTADELLAMIRGAGFEVVEYWKPKPKAAVFIIARKS